MLNLNLQKGVFVNPEEASEGDLEGGGGGGIKEEKQGGRGVWEGAAGRKPPSVQELII